MAKVEFHFDFGSPNAYLAHIVIPEVEQRTGATFKYVPILLGGVFKLTNNRSPAEKMAGIKNRLEYEQLEVRRFVRRHGIKQFTWNPFFPVNTLLIMRGAIAAQLDGVFERYVDDVFRAMWAEPKKDGRSRRGRRGAAAVRAGRRRSAHPHPGARRQGSSAEEYRSLGRARHFRQPHFLCRQRDVLRQGSFARRRGGDRSGQCLTAKDKRYGS
jgi:hypothetical protein